MNRSERRLKKKFERSQASILRGKGWNDFYQSTQDEIDTAAKTVGARRAPDRLFRNNIFCVQVFEEKTSWGPCERAMIRRWDESPIDSWDQIQRIKNLVFGVDRVALEVFPRDRYLVDVANLRWIWVFPLGWSCPIETISGSTG